VKVYRLRCTDPKYTGRVFQTEALADKWMEAVVSGVREGATYSVDMVDSNVDAGDYGVISDVADYLRYCQAN
jgi:hypothetical protein